MASRNQFPKWSADGKFIAYVSDKSGRDEIWLTAIPTARTPKKITDLDNEKGALVWTPGFEVAALHGSGQEALQLFRRATAKTAVVTSSDVTRIGSVSVSPRQQVGGVLETGSHAALARVHRTHRRRRRAARVGRQSPLQREQRRVDRRWPLPGRSRRAKASSNGIATPGRHRHDDEPVGRCRCATRSAIR